MELQHLLFRQQVVTAAVLLLLMLMELKLVLQQPFDGGGGCDWAVKAVELLVAVVVMVHHPVTRGHMQSCPSTQLQCVSCVLSAVAAACVSPLKSKAPSSLGVNALLCAALPPSRVQLEGRPTTTTRKLAPTSS